MEKKASFRVRVMSYAHHIFETTTADWSAALKKAWTLYRLAKLMRKGVVKFFYEKVDGSARVAYGTLCDLPAGITSRKGGKSPSYTTMCYWDTKKNAFRSFRVEKAVDSVSGNEKYFCPADGAERCRVALIDYGAKHNIIRSLQKRGCSVTVWPARTPAETILLQDRTVSCCRTVPGILRKIRSVSVN